MGMHVSAFLLHMPLAVFALVGVSLRDGVVMCFLFVLFVIGRR